MNAVLSLLLVVAGPLGTLKGHVVLGSSTNYKLLMVAVATRPAPPTPGRMGNFVMRLVKRVPLDSKGSFSTKLAPGTYDLGVYTRQNAQAPFPHETVTIAAGQTTTIQIKGNMMGAR